MSSDKIIFYDLPSDKVGSWSPNTWKARFALNYKGIPYKTEWIEYPDIAGKLKSWNAEPTSKKADGSPHYTLPAIYDPNTQKYVTESAEIAQYLDKTYPDTPILFPPGLNALQHAFNSVFMEKVSSNLRNFAIPQSWTILNEASQGYFRETREILWGKKLEDIPPKGEAKVQEMGKIKAGLDVINSFYEKGKADGEYLLGKEPGFADFVVASWIIWVRIVFGEESEMWKEVSSWHEGKWAKILDGFAKYQRAD